MSVVKNVAVVGGGAAGFFAAISVKTHHPLATVTLFEKSSNVLSKVKVSGGGRCNVTNANNDIASLCNAYPRGGKELKNIFYRFGPQDTKNWFKDREVSLKAEPDGRVFPVSNNSQTIIDCLMEECEKKEISIKYKKSVKSLKKIQSKWALSFNDSHITNHYDSVIIASGGSPKLKGFEWLKNIGHSIITPIPSLFTFNMPNESIIDLMGLVVKDVKIKISETKIETIGPVLITHWGMSGPVILKASSIGARDLFERDYCFNIEINWLLESNTELLYKKLEEFSLSFSKKTVINQNPFQFPNRLWQFLVTKFGVPTNKKWGELGKKKMRHLIELFTKDSYSVSGKTTFKEEFVTCGGVALSNININTMESKIHSNLYFAGEVLNIDAITGGYNFQAAWSTGFVARKLE